MARWRFLTNHARVLVCIASEPGIQQRYVAQRLDLTERAVGAIVGELCEAGYLTAHRLGARNFYEVHPELPLRGTDPEQGLEVGALLGMLLERDAQESEASA